MIVRYKDKQNSNTTLFFKKDYLNFATYLQIELSMKTDIDLNKLLWQLTVGEFLELMEQVPTVTVDNIPKEKRLLYGIAGIAQLFNCSMTTATESKQVARLTGQYHNVVE